MKIAVCALLVALCGCGGLFLAKKYNRKERLFFDLNNFCCSFNANLGYERAPVEKLLENNENLFGKDFLQLADVYLRGSEASARTEIITDAQADKIEQFFGLIGRGDAAAQREAVSAYGEYFKNELKNAENENKSKGNLNRKLGFLLGIFLSVLVL